jgi:DNA-binding MarR family transcriptional regulator
MQSPLDSLGFLVNDISRLMRRAFQQKLEGSDLTLAQARALIYGSRHERERQVDLAELLEIQPITLARLIDQLAEAGLVERRAHPDDRRAYRLYLTAAAAPRLTAVRQVAASVKAHAFAGLDKQQIASLAAALQKMHDNLAAR